MKRKESALRLGFTFAGCYLGAGYVSGQELWQFFGCFGWQGIAGLLLAVALSFFFGVLLLRLVQRTGCDQTDALVIRRPIPLLRDAVGLLQLFFLFGILVIMAAGVGALFAQILGASALWCSAAFCLLVSLLSLTGTSGMVMGEFALMKNKQAKLTFLADGAQIFVGDEVLTSGQGGAFPQGLVIGTITAVQTEAGGQIEFGLVQPQCNFESLVQVFVIKSFEVVE